MSLPAARAPCKRAPAGELVLALRRGALIDLVVESMPDENVAALPVGGIFHGRYEVVRCIKAGGMGAVYEVIHLETRRRRAMKVMLPSAVTNPALRSRFKLEATVAADIESEHIVETFDAGVDGPTGAPFLVMELLRGQDLGEMLQHRGRIPADETVQYLAQAALALEKTHAAGIVHRDLKPENLFVTRRDDGTPRLKILDFGIAKVVRSSKTGKTQTVGTPLYMAPEQIEGAVTIGPRTDLYAMGQIAFTLLAGAPYWTEDDTVFKLFSKIMQGTIMPASKRALEHGVELPAAFDAWFATATATQPGDRFAGAAALVDALAEALGASRAGSLVDASLEGEVARRVSAVPEAMAAAQSARSESVGGAPTLKAPNAEIARVAGEPDESRVPRSIFAIGAAVIVAGAAGVWMFARPSEPAVPPAMPAASSEPAPRVEAVRLGSETAAPEPVVEPSSAPPPPPAASASASAQPPPSSTTPAPGASTKPSQPVGPRPGATRASSAPKAQEPPRKPPVDPSRKR
jgi:eukaryotic-like serine/threonine-protein kinase